MSLYKRIFLNQDVCPHCGYPCECDIDDMTEGQLADYMAGFRYCIYCGAEYHI